MNKRINFVMGLAFIAPLLSVFLPNNTSAYVAGVEPLTQVQQKSSDSPTLTKDVKTSVVGNVGNKKVKRPGLSAKISGPEHHPKIAPIISDVTSPTQKSDYQGFGDDQTSEGLGDGFQLVFSTQFCDTCESGYSYLVILRGFRPARFQLYGQLLPQKQIMGTQAGTFYAVAAYLSENEGKKLILMNEDGTQPLREIYGPKSVKKFYASALEVGDWDVYAGGLAVWQPPQTAWNWADYLIGKGLLPNTQSGWDQGIAFGKALIKAEKLSLFSLGDFGPHDVDLSGMDLSNPANRQQPN